MATSFKTVLLGPSHPGYQAFQPQYVASGFLVNVEESFDPALYEIREGSVVDAVPFIEKTLSEQLKGMFKQALQDYDGLLPPLAEADLFLLKAGIDEMLDFGRLAAAQAKIQAVALPEALEPIRQAMLALFPPENEN